MVKRISEDKTGFVGADGQEITLAKVEEVERECGDCPGCDGKAPCAWREGYIDEDPKEVGFQWRARHNKLVGPHFALISLPGQKAALDSEAAVSLAGGYTGGGGVPVIRLTHEGTFEGILASPEKMEELEAQLTQKGAYIPDTPSIQAVEPLPDVLPAEVQDRVLELQAEVGEMALQVASAKTEQERQEISEAFESRRAEIQDELQGLYAVLRQSTVEADALVKAQAAARRADPLGLGIADMTASKKIIQ